VKKKWSVKLGILLILLSGMAFLVMLLFPFLNVENRIKAKVSGASFIAMEVLFWTGGLLVGKELFKKYKSYLDPRNWFRKRRK